MPGYALAAFAALGVLAVGYLAWRAYESASNHDEACIDAVRDVLVGARVELVGMNALSVERGERSMEVPIDRVASAIDNLAADDGESLTAGIAAAIEASLSEDELKTLLRAGRKIVKKLGPSASVPRRALLTALWGVRDPLERRAAIEAAAE